MMAILVLFLQAKFSLDETNAGIIYSVFYFSIYMLALVGGIIADRTKKYKTTIMIGLVLMSIGYFLLAIPTPTPVQNMPLILTITIIGLFSIAFGNGLFKGNLQAVVGQLYDNPKYSEKRETGFQIFYMFINIGAMFAPLLAVGLRNWWVVSHGYKFNADLPTLCNQHISGIITPEASARFAQLAADAGNTSADITTFAHNYLNIFMTGYHYSFGLAIIAMLISLLVFLSTKKNLPDPSAKVKKDTHSNEVIMDAKEVK